jgi:hypothetical protein
MISVPGNEGKAIAMQVVEFSSVEEAEIAVVTVKDNIKTLPSGVYQNAVRLN